MAGVARKMNPFRLSFLCVRPEPVSVKPETHSVFLNGRRSKLRNHKRSASFSERKVTCAPSRKRSPCLSRPRCCDFGRRPAKTIRGLPPPLPPARKNAILSLSQRFPKTIFVPSLSGRSDVDPISARRKRVRKKSLSRTTTAVAIGCCRRRCCCCCCCCWVAGRYANGRCASQQLRARAHILGRGVRLGPLRLVEPQDATWNAQQQLQPEPCVREKQTQGVLFSGQ
jgi:hypothetical protein